MVAVAASACSSKPRARPAPPVPRTPPPEIAVGRDVDLSLLTPAGPGCCWTVIAGPLDDAPVDAVLRVTGETPLEPLLDAIEELAGRRLEVAIDGGASHLVTAVPLGEQPIATLS